MNNNTQMLKIKDIKDENLRVLALERQTECISAPNINLHIHESFPWDQSYEGHCFWSGVSEEIIHSIEEGEHLIEEYIHQQERYKREKEEEDEIYIK